MDVEKEIFNATYLCDYPAFSLCQAPDNATCLYFGEGNGQLKPFDERVGKVSSKWLLHHDCIGSIDFNPENPNMLVTSSLDSTACLWDLRSMKVLKPESLKVVKHEHSVHSAYFSPSGSFLATTRNLIPLLLERNLISLSSSSSLDFALDSQQRQMHGINDSPPCSKDNTAHAEVALSCGDGNGGSGHRPPA
ncbi:hypothetical protein C2845_PM14G08650 [Panicum miliaceum]|uniref:Uncharacterized protein n=1 Tax=Panicum miliaceum TaxID=4540 RepID=A0A3L6PPG9_PANMI|nr:hypothetical protein C2845_PM14G08650 [Panicum miliaceum]